MNKILLIDDDRDFLNLLAIIAGDYGWEPYKAASVQEARKLLTQDNYHTVCIDFSLRDGTAIDVLGFMKDRGIDAVSYTHLSGLPRMRQTPPFPLRSPILPN